jgi:hypothetical protein
MRACRPRSHRWADHAAIYYTTNGSTPSGSRGASCLLDPVGNPAASLDDLPEIKFQILVRDSPLFRLPHQVQDLGIPQERRENPPYWNIPPDQFYIKRLVGLGGEKMQIGSDRHLAVSGAL